jgi:hypothetical protein
MSETTAAIETATLGLNTLEEYEPLVGTRPASGWSFSRPTIQT